MTVTGTLAADEEVVAGFKVAGRVSEIAVDLGSPVRKGQLLARLDPTDFRLRVEQAEAALRQVRAGLGLPRDGSGESVDPEKTALVREARAVLEEARLNRDRMAQLWEKNLIARSEVDASQSRLLVAESRYQAALEEIRNRQELLAERSSGLALARQQLADAVLSRADRRGRAGTPRFGGRVPGRRRSGVRPGPGPPAPASGGGAGTGRFLRAGRAGGPGPARRGTPRRTPAAWPA